MSRDGPAAGARVSTPIGRVSVAAYTVPTDNPEADGTFEWDRTTMVTVHVCAGDVTGFGYTYSDVAAGVLIEHLLADVIIGREAMDIESCYVAMLHAVRNS